MKKTLLLLISLLTLGVIMVGCGEKQEAVELDTTTLAKSIEAINERFTETYEGALIHRKTSEAFYEVMSKEYSTTKENYERPDSLEPLDNEMLDSELVSLENQLALVNNHVTMMEDYRKEIDSIKSKIDNGEYTEQSDIDADNSRLNDVYGTMDGLADLYYDYYVISQEEKTESSNVEITNVESEIVEK